MKKYTVLILFLIGTVSYGQVGIGTTSPSPASMLEVSGGQLGNYKGFMPPRVPDGAAQESIATALEDAGLIVFNETQNCLNIWDGVQWQSIFCFDPEPVEVVLLTESFESPGQGDRYNLSVAEFNESAGQDYFTRTRGDDIAKPIVLGGKDGQWYFAAQDIDGGDATGGQSLQSMTFNSIDIAGLTNLNFAVLIAENDALNGDEDWDNGSATNNEFLHFQYSIDGGAFVDFLNIESDAPAGSSNGRPRLDLDFDGIGEATEITNSWIELTETLPTGGSTLVLRILFNSDAGDEDMNIDFIRITSDL